MDTQPPRRRVRWRPCRIRAGTGITSAWHAWRPMEAAGALACGAAGGGEASCIAATAARHQRRGSLFRRPVAGRPRTVDVREVLNAVFYVLSTGCQWGALPKDLPPKDTVRDCFSRWGWEGIIERIRRALYVAVREQAGREAGPIMAIIGSQTAKGGQKGPPGSTRAATTRARRSSAARATC